MTARDVREEARRLLVERDERPSRETVLAALRDLGQVRGLHDVDDLVRAIGDDMDLAGPLTSLLADPDVTDVLVHQPGFAVVDSGHGMTQIPVALPDADAVRALAVRLAARAGRRLDDASPWVDGQLPDGTRIHAVIPPIVRDCTAISLRIPSRRALTLQDLIDRGSLTHSMAAALREVIRHHATVLICGATGVGKSTFLSALLSAVALHERIVILEDAPELAPAHPHVVRMVSRLPNLEGAGAVTVRDLVRQSLRMRPDRLVVGEIRGVEIVDLLQAFTTGHRGGATTLHAHDASEVPARLEALGLMAGVPAEAMARLAATAIDVIVDLGRDDGGRFVRGLHQLVHDAGTLRVVPLATSDAKA